MSIFAAAESITESSLPSAMDFELNVPTEEVKDMKEVTPGEGEVIMEDAK